MRQSEDNDVKILATSAKRQALRSAATRNDHPLEAGDFIVLGWNRVRERA
jgi:hypothetical protein